MRLQLLFSDIIYILQDIVALKVNSLFNLQLLSSQSVFMVLLENLVFFFVQLVIDFLEPLSMLILELCDFTCFVLDVIKLVIHYFEHAIKGFHSFFIAKSIELSLLLFILKHFGIAFFLKLLY